MRRPPGIRRTLFALAVFCAMAVFLAGIGMAESADVKASPRATPKDPASAIIAKQRSYVYERNPRDVFHDLFVEMTVTPSPTPKASPKRSGTAPVSEGRLDEARKEADALVPVMTRQIGEHDYGKVISACSAFAEKYKDLGKDLQTVMEPLIKLRKSAEEKKALVDSFKKVCDGINISAILWSERNQSVIINGRIYFRGEVISADFPNAPKDLKVIDITPKSIVVSSAELDLRQEIVFDPLLERPKGGGKK